MLTYSSRLLRLCLALSFAQLLLVSSCLSQAKANELSTLSAEITADRDGSLYVDERLTMRFTEPTRYFERDIPLKYSQVLGFKLLGVTEIKKQPVYFQMRQGGDRVRIRIGSPGSGFTGMRSFEIRYILRRAFDFASGKPELTLTVPGYTQDYPTNYALARLTLPGKISALSIDATANCGGAGGAQSQGRVDLVDSVCLFTGVDLHPHEALTLKVRLPAGSIDKLTPLKLIGQFASDWWPLFLLPMLSAFALYAGWLSLAGRSRGEVKSEADAKSASLAGTVSPAIPANLAGIPKLINVPKLEGTAGAPRNGKSESSGTVCDLAVKGLSALQIVFLRDGKVTTADFVILSVLELASAGLLKLTEGGLVVECPEGSYIDEVDEGDLAPSLLRVLQGRKVEVASLFSDRRIIELKELFERRMIEKELFYGYPGSITKGLSALGVVFIALGLVITSLLGSFNAGAFGLGLAFSGVIIAGFARFIPIRTPRGEKTLRYLEELCGAQEFITLAVYPAGVEQALPDLRMERASIDFVEPKSDVPALRKRLLTLARH